MSAFAQTAAPWDTRPFGKSEYRGYYGGWHVERCCAQVARGALYEWPSHDGFFLTEYRDALTLWFKGLSLDAKKATKVARAAFDHGDDAGASVAAATLPPAPVCPLKEM